VPLLKIEILDGFGVVTEWMVGAPDIPDRVVLVFSSYVLVDGDEALIIIDCLVVSPTPVAAIS
jgi:hypothetical protein